VSKINVNSIVADIQKLYAKDKKAQQIVCTGASVKQDYTVDDVVPFEEGSVLAELMALPGIPFNKIVQVAGKPDTGKSTLGLGAIATAQRAGIQVILWDSEDKFDAHRLKHQFGGNPDEVLLVKTNEIRYGGELVRKYVTAVKAQDKDAKILVVWDSVGGSQSRSHAEFELDSEKNAQPGQDAKENGMVCKALVALINKFPDSIAIYLVNQTYAKIGFMQKGDAAAGGTKIEYHSSFIVFLKRIKVLTKTVNKKLVKEGIIVRATVTKNHLSQGKTSAHQLDFKITAEGAHLLGAPAEDDDEEEAEE
jgi:RecA/RadA recombinase